MFVGRAAGKRVAAHRVRKRPVRRFFRRGRMLVTCGLTLFVPGSFQPILPCMSDSQTVRVQLGARAYDILIEAGALARLPALLESWHKPTGVGTAFLVTDANLAGSHAATVAAGLREAGWRFGSTVLPPGESSKSLPLITAMWDALVELQADRQTVVIAVGGGVVGDAAGFAAATYNRGLPFVQVPTSLLAMVDSSVGGKVGINHRKGKNLIGAFHQPLGVLIDPAVLGTLPEREYRSGLAEVVKYGVILDAEFFTFLEDNIAAINDRQPEVLATLIARSCRLKADVVEQDEQETSGRRAALNYGHTFAHAYEALAGYGTLTHGEAVAVGMIDAGRLAERRDLIDSSVTARQLALLTALGLPTALPAGMSFPAADVIARMRLDKKNTAGRLRFILPTRIGEVRLVDDVPEADVAAVLEGK